MKITLREHLNILDQNSTAEKKNIDSLVKRIRKKFCECGYHRASLNTALVLQYIHMIFNTQDYRCTHWIHVNQGELNGVWNRPGKDYNSWKSSIVKYEIDHVHPVNAGGSDRLDNFQFLSANANAFTKCSLTYEDLFKRVDLSDRLKNRIKSVLEKRAALFQSDVWKDFIQKLEEIEGRV